MATTIQTPYQVPIFNAQGSMNPQWLAWFNAVSSGLVSSSSGTVDEAQVVQIIENTVPSGLVDYTVPPRLTGFKVTGGFNMIFIEWDQPNYPSFGYVEIYRSNSEIFTYAIPVGTAIVNVFGDTPPDTSLAHTYYYWARAVSKAGIPGPFNAVLGTPGTTADDPTYLLQVLENQLSTDQLNNTLNSRINLIDDPSTGLVKQVSDTNAALAQETLDRAAAVNQEAADRIVAAQDEANKRDFLTGKILGTLDIEDLTLDTLTAGLLYDEKTVRVQDDLTEATTREGLAVALTGYTDPTGKTIEDVTTGIIAEEKTARINAVNGEASARDTLAIQLRGTYTGSDLNSVSTGLIYSEKSARISQGESLSEQIALLTAGVSGGFDPYTTYYFDQNTTGWSASGATISWSSGSAGMPGVMVITSTGSNPQVYLTSNLATPIVGSQYDDIKLRIKRTAGSGWKGDVYYRTAGHDFSGSYMVHVDDPGTVIGDIVVVDWMMSELADWSASNIINIRIDLGSSASDVFEVDWLAVGRNAPGASTASLLAEQTARATADSAEVSSRETLSSIVTGSTNPAGLTIDTLTSGLLYDEKSARSIADSTEVTARQSLATKVTGFADPTGKTLADLSSGLLYDEKTARSSADSSEVTARQTLATKVIGTTDPTGVTLNSLTSGLIYDEKTARSTSDAAEVTARQSMTATLTGYNDITGKTLADISTGIIAEEKTVRASADTANASSISTLSAQVNNPTTGLPAAYGYINAINDVSSSSTSANAQALYSVSSKVNNPSTGLDSKATVTELTTVNSNTLKSVATAINQTTTVLNGKTTTVETMAEAVDGVSGSYTVKVDSNGYVAGFGLAISGNTSTPTSAFRIVADAFSIAPTASSYGASAQSPFFHLSSTQYVPEMGVTLPAGTYMKSAYIGDATITSAKIGSLSADKITAGTIAAAVSMTSASITGGVITGGTIRTNPYGVGVVTIADDVLTVKDSNGVVRVKIGKLN